VRPEQYLPLMMLVMQLACSAGYAIASDWRRAVYWVAAAVLTAVVTW
jgi:hypothetical protein